MTNVHRDGSEKNPIKKEYEKLDEYIFSFVKHFEFDEYINDEYFPIRKLGKETNVH